MTEDPKKLRSFAELAYGTGRFEMQPTPRQGAMHYKSLIDFSFAKALGLFDAAQIWACDPVSRSQRHLSLLDSIGTREDAHWALRVPDTLKGEKAWDRLLKSDQVLVFLAPDAEWLSRIVFQAHSPFVAVFPSMSLTEGWIEFEKRAFAQLDSGVHVSIGAGRATITFVGKGSLFEQAVELAAQRPPLTWGYPPSAFRETLESRELIFPSGGESNCAGQV